MPKEIERGVNTKNDLIFPNWLKTINPKPVIVSMKKINCKYGNIFKVFPQAECLSHFL